MGKYTVQAKLAAVKEYCAGKAGLRDVAHRHDVDFSCLRQWVAAYQIHGPAALKEKKRQRYSDEFKLAVLKRMHDEPIITAPDSGLVRYPSVRHHYLWSPPFLQC